MKLTKSLNAMSLKMMLLAALPLLMGVMVAACGDTRETEIETPTDETEIEQPATSPEASPDAPASPTAP
ncbi:MAG: hypothetical protein IGS38_20480 [Synechococcales cyanobacterium M58_A2018_015]|nr:hypothetical protein [Synechococcales cyanobacterium M58_A2018_015]